MGDNHGMRVGSLFSGIGGFDLGFERAGFEIAWQCEFDKHAQAVLRGHWPDVPQFGDVRDVGAHNLPVIDVLVGGFPCQDISVAGRRAGLAGERSGLFYEYARIIDEMQPLWVVIENVPGLLSSGGRRDMGALLGTLGELGYGFAYRTLDAQFFGVAQRRRRVLIVGHLGADVRRAAAVLFESTSLRGDSPPSRETRQEIAGTLGGGSAGERGYRNDLDTSGAFVVPSSATVAVSPTLRAGGNSTGGHRPPGTDVDTCETLIVANAITASAGHHGRSSPRGDGADNLIVGLSVAAWPALSSSGGKSDSGYSAVLSRRGRDGGSADEIEEELSPALRAGDGGSSRALTVFAIQDGREIEKRQNGLGVSGVSVPMYTLDGTGAQAVGVISGEGSDLVPTVSAKWHKGSGGPAGDECQKVLAFVPEVSSTISGGAHPGGLNGQDAIHQAVPPLGVVRRLTPKECERLQGFPDDWTNNGQADSHRYRQIGNAVAVPVAGWLASRIALEGA